MPVLCMFYGIIVRMYRELGGKHNIPHIHVEYSGQEAVIGWWARCWKESFRRAR